MWLYIVGGLAIIGLLIGAFILGQKSYVRRIRSLGSLIILIDEVDGSKYPMVELNNDRDLWECKTGDIAMFLVNRRDKK